MKDQFLLLQQSPRGQLAVRSLLLEARESLLACAHDSDTRRTAEGTGNCSQLVYRIYREANTRLTMERGNVAQAWTAMQFQPHISPSVALNTAEEWYLTYCILERRSYDADEFFRRLVAQLTLVEPFSECAHSLAQGDVVCSDVAMFLKFERVFTRLKVKARIDEEAATRVKAPTAPPKKPQAADKGGGGSAPTAAVDQAVPVL
jgi:hypothetical protein